MRCGREIRDVKASMTRKQKCEMEVDNRRYSGQRV
jgi:hypothetical protein